MEYNNIISNACIHNVLILVLMTFNVNINNVSAIIFVLIHFVVLLVTNNNFKKNYNTVYANMSLIGKSIFFENFTSFKLDSVFSYLNPKLLNLVELKFFLV